MWPRLINIAIGIWMMAAPAVLGYGGTLAADHGRIVGPVVASLACVAIWGATRPLRWANLPIGLWLLIAPWVLGFPTPAMVNSMLCGAVIAAVSLVRGTVAHRFGGGWSELWRSSPRAQPSG